MKRTSVDAYVLVGLALASALSVRGLRAQTGLERPEPQLSVELPAELSRVLTDYERYWRAGQEDELAALFVEEGLIVRSGSWVRGRAAIRDAYRSASGPLRLRAIEYAANGEIGYIVGAYGYGEDLPVEDTGMFVLTLRRHSSGRWLIASDLDPGAG